MAVQCLSVLDALRSLSEYSKCATGGALCRPEFVMSCDQVDSSSIINTRYGFSYLKFLIAALFETDADMLV